MPLPAVIPEPASHFNGVAPLDGLLLEPCSPPNGRASLVPSRKWHVRVQRLAEPRLDVLAQGAPLTNILCLRF